MVECGKGDYKSAINNLRPAQNIYQRTHGNNDVATSRLINDYQHYFDKDSKAIAA